MFIKGIFFTFHQKQSCHKLGFFFNLKQNFKCFNFSLLLFIIYYSSKIEQTNDYLCAFIFIDISTKKFEAWRF